jgi:outer membrane lipoprotein SlyB
MSFCSSFEKIAEVRDMSDIELTLKANKHLGKVISHDKAHVTGAITGAGIGGLASMVIKDKSARKAAASVLGGAVGGSIAGQGVKKWYQGKLRRESGELKHRGIYAVPRGNKIYWVKKQHGEA